MTDDSESTNQINYYHRRRNQLMRRILERTEPMVEDLDEETEPFCLHCGRGKTEVYELHIHHPGGNPDPTDRGMSGWDLLYMNEDHLEDEDVGQVVLCVVCHYLAHRDREDGHGERLTRRHGWLEEAFDDRDVEAVRRDRCEGRDERVEQYLERSWTMPDHTADVESDGSGGEKASVSDRLRDRVLDRVEEQGPVDEQTVIDDMDGTDEDVERIIHDLMRQGELFKPKPGTLMRV